jgi:hypothetical protein
VTLYASYWNVQTGRYADIVWRIPNVADTDIVTTDIVNPTSPIQQWITPVGTPTLFDITTAAGVLGEITVYVDGEVKSQSSNMTVTMIHSVSCLRTKVERN